MCMSKIKSLNAYIKTLNITLINYTEEKQKVIDCGVFNDEYQFPFLFEYE